MFSGVRKPPWPLQLLEFKHVFMQVDHENLEKSLRESARLVVENDEFSGPGNEAVRRKAALVVPKHEDDDEDPPSLYEQFQRCYKFSINDDASSVYVKGFFGNAAAVKTSVS
ncbi:hypothetical protein DM02DRAFT_628584 [Periconia macrospinosa]|uniref:Uncharacterized protein n=1 Tax=Periconia macrospinosa TaxID=97972 RepID=A0A2V1DT30_9PLEO|nr:hypothetical protein DM02DRAFT_628584 [Periconia macrospinosa]